MIAYLFFDLIVGRNCRCLISTPWLRGRAVGDGVTIVGVSMVLSVLLAVESASLVASI